MFKINARVTYIDGYCLEKATAERLMTLLKYEYCVYVLVPIKTTRSLSSTKRQAFNLQDADRTRDLSSFELFIHETIANSDAITAAVSLKSLGYLVNVFSPRGITKTSDFTISSTPSFKFRVIYVSSAYFNTPRLCLRVRTPLPSQI
jgi:hypothetical protein